MHYKSISHSQESPPCLFWFFSTIQADSFPRQAYSC